MSYSSRLQKVDIARAVALIGMVIYHLSWDLAYFSYLPPDTAAHGILKILARIVAASFLFLCGFSLFLSHHHKIKWRSFWKRFAIITSAACFISLASYFLHLTILSILAFYTKLH